MSNSTVDQIQAGIEQFWSRIIPADHTAHAVNSNRGYWEVTITDQAGTERESHRIAADIKGSNTLEISSHPYRAVFGTVELPQS